MIGMMYLVLTALLALNVSAEILNAFVLVDNSLTATANNYAKKNDKIYTDFETAYMENQNKVGPWKNKADEVKVLAQEVFDYIHGIKLEIIGIADGSTTLYEANGPAGVQKKDDNNVPGQVMILQGRGLELKAKIDEFRTKLIGMIEDQTKYEGVVSSINKSLNTDPVVSANEGDSKPWEEANFNHLPLSGVLTMLTKMQTDIRNSETDILGYLFGQIDAGTFKFNKIEAIVNSPTNYVLVGNEYKAEVFIAASDSSVEPVIELNGGGQLPIVEGKGIYTGSTSAAGVKTWGGVIKLESPATGEILEYPFKSEYQVGEAALVVSPTKMNVFYIGVDNPVDISVPGVPADKIVPSINNGSITRSGNGYIVRVRTAGEAKISVTADFGSGARSMGTKTFRVKLVPDPVAKVAGKKEGVIARGLLTASQGVTAELENFDFDLKFTIVSFTVSATIKGYAEEAQSNSNLFTAQQKAIMNQVATGQKIYIENIKAKGPDGTIRSLPAIGFKLQ